MNLDNMKQGCIDMVVAYASTLDKKEINSIKQVGPLIHYVYKDFNDSYMEGIVTDVAKACENALKENGYTVVNPICGIKFKNKKD